MESDINGPLNQLEKFVDYLEKERHDPLPIQNKMLKIRDAYRVLNSNIDHYLVLNGDSIIDKFRTILEIFSHKRIDLPEEIRQELITDWRIIEEVLKPRLLKLCSQRQTQEILQKLGDIKNQIDSLKLQTNHLDVGLDEPLSLKNIGNSCYMDSVLQALLCVKKICEQLNETIPYPSVPVAPQYDNTEEYKKKLAEYQYKLKEYKNDVADYRKKLEIQKELLHLINGKKVKDVKSYSQMELILFLMNAPSLYRLRSAIFKSGLHPELQLESLYEQHDAAYIMELFSHALLPSCKFQWEEHTETADFPGLDFIKRVECNHVLQVPLRIRPENQTLMRMIQYVICKHPVRNESRKFKVKNNAYQVKVTDEEKGAISLNLPPKKVQEYHLSYRFKELPQVLLVQCIRFKQETIGTSVRTMKNDSPVVLPDDLIIDLTDYFDPSPGGQQTARYKIRSVVIHQGPSKDGGHYVTNLEINGKYHHCNDIGSEPFYEIKDTEFKECKDAYLIVLERLPDEKPPAEVAIEKKDQIK
jgi:hypothetical protein